mgnify:CR=1 FL=1
MESAFSKKTTYDKIFKTVFVVLLLSSLTAGVTLVTNKDNPTIKRILADVGMPGMNGPTSTTPKQPSASDIAKKAKEHSGQTSSTSQSSSSTTPKQPSAQTSSTSQSSSSTSSSSNDIGCGYTLGGICREFTTKSGNTYYSNPDGTYIGVKDLGNGQTETWLLDSDNNYIKGTTKTLNKTKDKVMQEIRNNLEEQQKEKEKAKQNQTPLISCGGGVSSSACFCTQSTCYWNDVNGNTHQAAIGSDQWQSLMTVLNNQDFLKIKIINSYSRLGIDNNGDGKIDQSLDPQKVAEMQEKYTQLARQIETEQQIERLRHQDFMEEQQKINLAQAALNQYQQCLNSGGKKCEAKLSNPEILNTLIEYYDISFDLVLKANPNYSFDQYLKLRGLTPSAYHFEQEHQFTSEMGAKLAAITNYVNCKNGGGQNCESFVSKPEIFNYLVSNGLISYEEAKKINNAYTFDQYVKDSGTNPTSPTTAQLKDSLSNIFSTQQALPPGVFNPNNPQGFISTGRFGNIPTAAYLEGTQPEYAAFAASGLLAIATGGFGGAILLKQAATIAALTTATSLAKPIINQQIEAGNIGFVTAGTAGPYISAGKFGNIPTAAYLEGTQPEYANAALVGLNLLVGGMSISNSNLKTQLGLMSQNVKNTISSPALLLNIIRSTAKGATQMIAQDLKNIITNPFAIYFLSQDIINQTQDGNIPLSQALGNTATNIITAQIYSSSLNKGLSIVNQLGGTSYLKLFDFFDNLDDTISLASCLSGSKEKCSEVAVNFAIGPNDMFEIPLSVGSKLTGYDLSIVPQGTISIDNYQYNLNNNQMSGNIPYQLTLSPLVSPSGQSTPLYPQIRDQISLSAQLAGGQGIDQGKSITGALIETANTGDSGKAEKKNAEEKAPVEKGEAKLQTDTNLNEMGASLAEELGKIQNDLREMKPGEFNNFSNLKTISDFVAINHSQIPEDISQELKEKLPPAIENIRKKNDLIWSLNEAGLSEKAKNWILESIQKGKLNQIEIANDPGVKQYVQEKLTKKGIDSNLALQIAENITENIKVEPQTEKINQPLQDAGSITQEQKTEIEKSKPILTAVQEAVKTLSTKMSLTLSSLVNSANTSIKSIGKNITQTISNNINQKQDKTQEKIQKKDTKKTKPKKIATKNDNQQLESRKLLEEIKKERLTSYLAGLDVEVFPLEETLGIGRQQEYYNSPQVTEKTTKENPSNNLQNLIKDITSGLRKVSSKINKVLLSIGLGIAVSITLITSTLTLNTLNKIDYTAIQNYFTRPQVAQVQEIQKPPLQNQSETQVVPVVPQVNINKNQAKPTDSQKTLPSRNTSIVSQYINSGRVIHPKTARIDQIALTVFAETANGTDPDWVQELLAWSVINRAFSPDIQAYYTQAIGVLIPAVLGESSNAQTIEEQTIRIANIFLAQDDNGNPVNQRGMPITGSYEKPVACKSQCARFKNTLRIVQEVYQARLRGEKDPTGGAVFFSKQSKLERRGISFRSPGELRNWIITNSQGLSSHYVSEPFQQMYWDKRTDQVLPTGEEQILYLGNHVCVSTGNCGGVITEGIIPKIIPQKIMIMGDSIAQGLTSNKSTKILNEKLSQSQKPYVFTGTQPSTTGGVNNEAYKGITAQNYYQKIISGEINFTSTNTPDIVVIQLGTNDLASGIVSRESDIGSKFIEPYKGIISSLRQANPSVEIIVMPVPESKIDWNSLVDDLNKALVKMVEGLNKDTNYPELQIIIANNGNPLFTQSQVSDDGVHPLNSGISSMAEIVSQEILDIINSQSPQSNLISPASTASKSLFTSLFLGLRNISVANYFNKFKASITEGVNNVFNAIKDKVIRPKETKTTNIVIDPIKNEFGVIKDDPEKEILKDRTRYSPLMPLIIEDFYPNLYEQIINPKLQLNQFEQRALESFALHIKFVAKATDKVRDLIEEGKFDKLNSSDIFHIIARIHTGENLIQHVVSFYDPTRFDSENPNEINSTLSHTLFSQFAEAYDAEKDNYGFNLNSLRKIQLTMSRKNGKLIISVPYQTLPEIEKMIFQEVDEIATKLISERKDLEQRLQEINNSKRPYNWKETSEIESKIDQLRKKTVIVMTAFANLIDIVHFKTNANGRSSEDWSIAMQRKIMGGKMDHVKTWVLDNMRADKEEALVKDEYRKQIEEGNRLIRERERFVGPFREAFMRQIMLEMGLSSYRDKTDEEIDSLIVKNPESVIRAVKTQLDIISNAVEEKYNTGHDTSILQSGKALANSPQEYRYVSYEPDMILKYKTPIGIEALKPEIKLSERIQSPEKITETTKKTDPIQERVRKIIDSSALFLKSTWENTKSWFGGFTNLLKIKVNGPKKTVSNRESAISIDKDGFVNQAYVNQKAREIKDAYNLSEEQYQRVKDTIIQVLDKGKFSEKIILYLEEQGFINKEKLPETPDFEEIVKMMRKDIETLKADKERQRKMAEEWTKRFGGIHLQDKDGKSFIYIMDNPSHNNQEPVFIHELLHAAASFGKGRSGFNTEDGKYHNLNEAATQILTLHMLYPDLDAQSLLKKIISQEITTPYRKDVIKLLSLLYATAYSKNPITIEKLSEYYFGNEDGTKPITLALDIARNAEPKTKDAVDKILDYFIFK